MMNKKDYHSSVLLHTCVDALLAVDTKPRIFVDVTFGGGGHSTLLQQKMNAEDSLYSFDKDEDVQSQLFENDNFHFIQADFKDLKKYLKVEGVSKVNGILADLGVSSYQFDTAERGFSIRYDAELDMRMDQSQSLDAKKIVNEYSETELERLLEDYAEITNASQVAHTICQARKKGAIHTTGELIMLLRNHLYGKEEKYLACVFQALRIEVNGELDALRKLLVDGCQMLESGGRMVVMSYHSLEDRLVKNYFKNGVFENEVEKDVFGNRKIEPMMKPLHSKAIVPDEKEIKSNPRSRSAKLRIGVKL